MRNKKEMILLDVILYILLACVISAIIGVACCVALGLSIFCLFGLIFFIAYFNKRS